MKTRKENRRSFIVTLTMALLMATMLMGCASKEVTEETEKTEATVVKEEVAAEGVEVKEAEPTLEPTPEPTAEPTPEPTPEPIVYEGVDMESTLPGEEWIFSLKGLIEEPKLIVFNDENNKKVIVEEGQEVEFAANDILGIYMPEGEYIIIKEDNDTFCSVTSGKVLTLKEVFPPVLKKGSSITENIVEFKGEELKLTATLIFVE